MFILVFLMWLWSDVVPAANFRKNFLDAVASVVVTQV